MLKFMSIILFIIFSIPVTAQTPLFSIPISGMFDNGERGMGQTDGYKTGYSIFWVRIPGKYTCSGEYNFKNPNPTLILNVTCDNGVSGEAIVTRFREYGYMHGTAIVSLSNGRTGNFTF